MRSISVGRLDSLIWLCFLHEGSVCTTRSRLLYEITWILYQLCHLGPITWATDEQDTHTHTQLQPVEGEEYTLHSSCVYSLHRPGRMCSESNFKYDHFATKNTNWGAVIAAPADLNNAQLCHWILVAGSHSEERRPKGQACRLFLGHLKVESQGAWWCMTHRAFWPRSGDSDSLISVKNELHPKNLHFWSICVNIYKKRPDWWEKFVNYRNVKLI